MKKQTQNNRRKHWLLTFLLAVTLTLAGCTSSDLEGQLGQTTDEASSLQVHFIDVGQGDATLLVCGGDAMLIDAGDNSQGTNVQNYLEKQGVTTLKYAIGTHPDADHIGGLDVVITKFDCETILMPNRTAKTATYRDVIEAANYKRKGITVPQVGETYTLGDASFTILSPERDYEDSNNCSIALMLTHGENRFLFTGDAEEEAETDMVESGVSLAADVYQVGHHGSRTSTSDAFLEKIAPAYAVISCGEDNSYGHPHAETMNKLRAAGVKVFRTDEQGSILAVSDGEKITWNTSAADSWQAGEPIGSAAQGTAGNESIEEKSEPEQEKETEKAPKPESEKEPEIEEEPETDAETEKTFIEEKQTYICNINTNKFHKPDCSAVSRMDEENRQEITCTRQALLDEGYEPCGICEP